MKLYSVWCAATLWTSSSRCWMQFQTILINLLKMFWYHDLYANHWLFWLLKIYDLVVLSLTDDHLYIYTLDKFNLTHDIARWHFQTQCVLHAKNSWSLFGINAATWNLYCKLTIFSSDHVSDFFNPVLVI